jgi:hypothetical protein
MKKELKIFDLAFAHEDYCGSKLGGNYSEKIVWNRNRTINNGDIVFFTDTSLNIVESINVECIKIAWLIEPIEIQPWSYNYIISNHRLFDHVLTYDSQLLNISNKFIKNPMWCSWVHPENHGLHSKSKNLSIIASSKNGVQGHQLRHDFISKYKNEIDFDIFGGLTSGNSGYKPIYCKSEGLSDYRFSVVIENVKKDFFFTEKIVDCFLTGTIPIYWGCNNIGDYFDTRGILNFNNLEELGSILKKINNETYERMFEYVKNNYEIASKFKTVEDFIYEEFLKINNYV